MTDLEAYIQLRTSQLEAELEKDRSVQTLLADSFRRA